MKQNKLIKLVTAALFTALIFIATYVIQIQIPIGYFNLGDCFVLAAGFMLGPVYGALAAGIGSALADMQAYAQYAPATFIIKAIMAVAAYFIFKALKSAFKGKLSLVSYLISSIVAEVIMVLGYFFFESVILGLGLGAAASILGNVTQGAVGAAAAVVLVSALEKAASKSKTISSFFKAGIK